MFIKHEVCVHKHKYISHYCFAKCISSTPLDYCDLFCIRNNRDYRLCKICCKKSKNSCDNHDNYIQQEAIIIFCKKLKTPFRINPILSVHMMVWFGLSAFLAIRVDTRFTFWNSHEKQDSLFRQKILARFSWDSQVKISSETRFSRVSQTEILLWESREASLATKFCSENCFLWVS